MTIADLLGRPSKLLLCFHAVDDAWPDPGLCVPVARFESAVAHLEQAGYRGETFSTVVAAPSDERLVAITFDDAFESVATAAAPILEARGWPGTVFVPTATLEGDGLHWIDPEVKQRHPIATRQVGPDTSVPSPSRAGRSEATRTRIRCCRAFPTQTSARSSRSPATSSARSSARATRSRTVGRGGRPRGRGAASPVTCRVGPERPIHVERADEARRWRSARSTTRSGSRSRSRARTGTCGQPASGRRLRPYAACRASATRPPASWRRRAVALLNLFHLH